MAYSLQKKFDIRNEKNRGQLIKNYYPSGITAMKLLRTVFLTARKYKWGVLLGLVLLVFILSVFSKPGLEEVYHWSRSEKPAASLDQSVRGPSPFLSSQDIYVLLRSVIDEELDVNIVDLGLIYDVKVQAREAEITMTMTTPGCPYARELIDGVRQALFSNPEVQKATLRITYDPPWHVRNISAEARKKLFGSGSGGDFAQRRGDS